MKPFLFNLAVFLSITITATAQDGEPTRKITSDDFVKARPATGVKGAGGPSQRHYRFIRNDRNPVSGRKPAPVKLVPKTTDIGVTAWKMRPPRSGESGYLMPVVVKDGTREEWLAERIDVDSELTAGDKIRFAFESSTRGYLYVIDREIYSDGRFGEPFLIFPASSKDDNSVRPGMLVDIPDQTEDLPYFKIEPKNPNYAGELLTVIVSPTRLTTITTDVRGKIANANRLIGIELASDFEVFTRGDDADKIYSAAEAESACGVKTRQLERVKSPTSPCGSRTRQLTRDEPPPQTIYRVKGFAGKPAVAFLKLRVRSGN